MTSFSQTQPIDGNNRTLSGYGFLTTDSQTLIGNNTTVVVPIFAITGAVEILGLWGIVTTALQNNTAAYFRLNDQTAQSNITLNTGTTLTNALAGALIVKKGLAGAAVTLLDATQERVSEPTTLETTYCSPCVVLKKPGAETDIEFVYTTSDAPTTGAIQFFCRWNPMSADANVVGL